MSSIHVQFSDDGQHIRRWSTEPFDGGTPFRAVLDELPRVESLPVRLNPRVWGFDSQTEMDAAFNAAANEAVVSQQALCLETHKRLMVVDDVTQIAQRVPFIEVAPARLFDIGTFSELADASDRLAATVAKLKEKIHADG